MTKKFRATLLPGDLVRVKLLYADPQTDVEGGLGVITKLNSSKIYFVRMLGIKAKNPKGEYNVHMFHRHELELIKEKMISGINVM